MHITLYVTQVCNTIHRNIHKLQNRNNWLSNRKTYLLIYNAGVFTFTKPDNTYILFSINSLWCGCISTLRPEICKPDLSCILHYHWYLNKRNSRRCVTYLLQGNQSCRNLHHSTKGTAEHYSFAWRSKRVSQSCYFWCEHTEHFFFISCHSFLLYFWLEWLE